MNQNYNPKEWEDKIYQQWIENKVGEVGNESSEAHTILMPPPNLTGNLHAGHAFQHYLMDTLTRVYRQKGVDALWVPGVDHAGIQLEGVIDKMFKTGEAKQVITDEMRNHPEFPEDQEDLTKFLKKNYRDDWLKFAWSKVDEWRDFQKNQAKVLGDTPDYSRNLFTLDDRAVEMVNYAFKKYWEDGLIYKKSYLINWSVGLQTALSDVPEDIGRETRKDPFVTFEYEAKAFTSTDKEAIEFGEKYLKPICDWPRLQLSTVRIETKFTDIAVAMHPSKFSEYFNEEIFEVDREGYDPKQAEHFLKTIQDYTTKIFYYLPALKSGELQLIFYDKVDPDFGTGIVKITPGHDMFDYETYNLFVDKGVLQPKPIQTAVGRDGKLTEVAGEYAGLKVEESRPRVMKRLLETGYIPVDSNYEGEVGDKSNLLSDEEFNNLSMELQFKYLRETYPENMIDWNYEHNVTICERSKTVVEPLISEEFFLNYFEPTSRGGKTLQELALEGIGETEYFSENFREMGENFVNNIHDWVISRDLVWGHKMPVWYNLDTNPEKKFFTANEIEGNEDKFRIQPEKPEGGNWVQESKILDTWFSSCLWPLSTLNYLEATKEIDWEDIPKKVDEGTGNDFFKFYSTDEMITAREIFYAWVTRMTMLGKYFTGRVPFKKVVITPTIQDEKGRKMSKSLKNGLDPLEAIEKFSSDSLRLAMLGGMIPNRNMKMGGKLADTLLEKQRNFGNKLWNVARFLDSK